MEAGGAGEIQGEETRGRSYASAGLRHGRAVREWKKGEGGRRWRGEDEWERCCVSERESERGRKGGRKGDREKREREEGKLDRWIE